MSEEKRLMIENDLCMNKSKAQVIKLYLDLLDDDIKQKEILDKIKNCILKDISILKNQRKMSNEEMKMRLEATLKILEEIE